MTDHRQLAVDLFNQTWELLELEFRTPDQDAEMMHKAHASRYHWGIAGNEQNLAIGEWQISRVYSVLGMPESALYHAERSLHHCDQGDLSPFYRGYAHEACMRAHLLAGNVGPASEHQAIARRLAATVDDEHDREALLKDLRP